jgi:hypothetical protein
MIIVSQDKDNIVNFDNVVSVGIIDFDINDKNCWQRITAETLGTAIVLGDYKTEERAKEVLKEMTGHYHRLKRNSVYAMGDSGFSFDEKFYYEMPKE